MFEPRTHQPDVVLVDVVMPGKSGIDAISDLLKDAPAARILVLSMQDDPRYVREAFEAGAAGWVLKEAADTDVVSAVREVAAGGHYVHPALGARLLAAEAAERRRPEADPLSDPRARRPPAARPRPHERGDREDALHLGADSRDAPRPHHAEASPADARRLVRYALEQGLMNEDAT